ncbi:MAG: FadR/GntR family transcriptional regulator [Christensenellales bacterium]|nr:FadR/GntR family transcriptional regulator [Christensenellales bacterium]
MMRAIKKEDKLYIQTFREIRSYIVRHSLKPGDLLPTELEMSQTLGVSRNVLREAIKSMELMGMVQACPGRGTEVKEFSLDFVFQNVLFFNVGGEDKPVHEMFGIRRMLELGYMRQAFYTLNEEDIQLLRDCVHRMHESIHDDIAFTCADRDFHMALFRPLQNGVLNSLMEAIWAVDEGFELEKKSPHLISSIPKHQAIVDALSAYDYRAFAKAMEIHFSSGKYLKPDSFEEYDS